MKGRDVYKTFLHPHDGPPFYRVSSGSFAWGKEDLTGEIRACLSKMH
jgi:hypothetical protein